MIHSIGSKVFTLSLLLTIASGFVPVNAALITHNGYMLNTNTNIVTGGGLEWLQWDVTLGMSISDALTNVAGTFDGGGWTLATNMQVSVLFDAFSFASDTNDNESSRTRGTYIPGTDDSIFDHFLTIFGMTRNTAGGDFGTGVDAFQFSSAYFGSDPDSDSLYRLAFARSDYTLFGYAQQESDAVMQGDWSKVTDRNEYNGVALVRAVVPEPSTITVLVLGFLGLVMRRRAVA